MDVDEPTEELELVPDDFGEREHEEMDANILCELNSENINKMAPLVLALVVAHSRGRLLSRYASIPECMKLINDNPRVQDMIYNGSINGFKEVRLLKLLRPVPIVTDDQRPEAASTVIGEAWNGGYCGRAAEALWNCVKTLFDQARFLRSRTKYIAIVQSSGMGKSRAVDEMSKSHFVIPVTLLSPKSSGYPPSDKPAYNYLTDSHSQRDAFLRSCAFLHALFLKTADVVGGFGDASLEVNFREYMTNGMRFKDHNENRSKFYEAVVMKAENVYYEKYWNHLEGRMDFPSCARVDQTLLLNDFPLRDAFRTLSEGLKMIIERRLTKGQETQGPFVVLAFDEIHTLLDSKRSYEIWSRFGEMRRAMRALGGESLVILLLSTSPTVFSVMSATTNNPQTGFLSVRDTTLPFYDLGFDQLAEHVKFSEEVSLSHIASYKYLISYGRPMWRPYYPWYKSSLVGFAITKLLCETYRSHMILTQEQQFAVLAQRIPIEFFSANHDSPMSDMENEQVTCHMRVVLKVDDDLQTMVTKSPSEPILSEAAAWIMCYHEGFSPPRALEMSLRFAVHTGHLGELLVALLFTTARDNAVTADNMEVDFDNFKRWCSITDLLQHLFFTPSSFLENHVDVTASPGWHFTRDGTERLQSSLADTFKDSKVYFTHFVKVHQPALVGVQYLMRLMARGAAIFCGDTKCGVDGVIPFLLRDDEIKPDNIGVIMFQVKDDPHFTDEANPSDVRGMDPYHRRLMDCDGVPVIRVVFSLAAHAPALKIVHHEPSYKALQSYTAYDFWVAGLSPELLIPVAKDTMVWNCILNASRGWKRNYVGRSELNSKLIKSMNPGAADEEEFWENWCGVPE